MTKPNCVSEVRGNDAKELQNMMASGSYSLVHAGVPKSFIEALTKTQTANIAGKTGSGKVTHTPYKLFCIEGDYIIAMTQKEAVDEYLSRTDENENELEIEELSLDQKGRFETANGYACQTFAEFLGENFIYTKPQVICWKN